jgi:hypothetical protein
VKTHEITIANFLKIYNKETLLIGTHKEHVLYLYIGYRFAYSIENIQKNIIGDKIYKMKKLSGFVEKRKLPHSIVILQLVQSIF